MSNFLVLFIGELQRMKKYHILGASFVIALLWIGVLHLTEIQNVSNIFPLLLFLDATSMSILMIGVTMFFEKQEGSMKSLLVSPIHKLEYILAKTGANIVSNLLTLVLLFTYAMMFKELELSLLWLIFAVILISFFHSLLGFLLTYYSKDFTQLLMAMMKYSFVFIIPVLLEQIGLITNDFIVKLLYAIPTKASMILLNASIGVVETWEIVVSILYLFAISVGVLFVVLKKHDEFALKESGV
ncbi:ABC transporter permease [Anaerobacillus isosaccharinicus]|uniref:ABC transporter permease n=1 Tax=Anaerobacillus isosaccharinicus TaxID=1532552 RepID=A0A1S2KTR4_9BACI|nr:ABC transporter permease [Anaerobacillus isosaccharinicus]MBA5588032.1 ABC transporter permease [Anaerobacillus isosaccharinicus]QOY33828.1 ABC transporter permease [Anaerobacillus isosaccharinicus]